MKKLLVGLTLAMTAMTASAHGGWGGHGGYGGYHGGYYGGYHGYNNNWVAPALIGGIIGYELSQPRYVQPTYIQPAPPVIYQQMPGQSCTAWVESIDQYGNVTRTRSCY
jgi:hypothetical protein